MNAMNGRQLADHICRVLRDRGHQAYLAGGCVRDILLGREPVDYDVATDATPDRVQELFPEQPRSRREVRRRHRHRRPHASRSRNVSLATLATPTAAIPTASSTPARPKKT